MSALRELYKTLEFSSLLRELAPVPKSRPRSAITARIRAIWMPGSRRIPAMIAVAVGDVMEQAVFGLCAKPGWLGRSRLEAIPARATIAHDIKNLLRRFEDAPALKHDVMLYGFLLSADPGGCTLPQLAEKYLDQALEADPASHADATFALFKSCGPKSRRSVSPSSTNPSTCRWCVCWPEWRKRASASIPRS